MSEAAFWDRIAARYARQPVADEASYQHKLEVTQTYLRPGMEVLEFGCGTGSTALVHAPHVGRIRAIDVSPRMIDIARGKAAEQGVDNVAFECATLDELAAPEASVDAVLGLNILHLLDDRDRAIAQVYALLKPGGVLVTSTACLGDSMLRFLGLIAPLGRWLRLLPLVRVFTTDELVASLERAGFAIEHRWQPGPRKAVFIVARKPA